MVNIIGKGVEKPIHPAEQTSAPGSSFDTFVFLFGIAIYNQEEYKQYNQTNYSTEANN